MPANLLFILASLLILVTIGLLWLRHSLLQDLMHLQAVEQKLRKDLELQRDKVPYLLEALKEEGESTDAWRRCRMERTALLDASTFEQELNFHTFLKQFLAEAKGKSLGFLEAKKNIEKFDPLVELGQQELAMRREDFLKQEKKFPFSLASAIFGL